MGLCVTAAGQAVVRAEMIGVIVYQEAIYDKLYVIYIISYTKWPFGMAFGILYTSLGSQSPRQKIIYSRYLAEVPRRASARQHETCRSAFLSSKVERQECGRDRHARHGSVSLLGREQTDKQKPQTCSASFRL